MLANPSAAALAPPPARLASDRREGLPAYLPAMAARETHDVEAEAMFAMYMAMMMRGKFRLVYTTEASRAMQNFLTEYARSPR
jgi:hypothetical protein